MTTNASAQRLPESAWNLFPSQYMMTQQHRNRSQGDKHTRNADNPYHSTSTRQQREQPFLRASASTNLSNGYDPSATARTRTRLQNSASQQKLNHSASTTSVVMPQSSFHRGGPSSNSQDVTALPQLADAAIPARRSSLRRKPVGGTDDPTSPRRTSPTTMKSTPQTHGQLSIRPKTSSAEHDNSRTQPDYDSDSHSSSSSSSYATASRTPRHQPLAPNDPSPLNPLYHIPTASFVNGDVNDSTGTRTGEHILLPEGFKPGKTEHTYVEETMMPAVTHEVIKHHRTEIVQEAITRDIHVHHYYTYAQPIKAIEILPARHFMLDTETGEKIEIKAPEGWVMPSNMQPYRPDFSALEPEERHYLVDEQHPTGVPEIPEISALNEQSSMKGNWTPFPRTRAT